MRDSVSNQDSRLSTEEASSLQRVLSVLRDESKALGGDDSASGLIATAWAETAAQVEEHLLTL